MFIFNWIVLQRQNALFFEVYFFIFIQVDPLFDLRAMDNSLVCCCMWIGGPFNETGMLMQSTEQLN